jgi:DNA (cytosine-5)-methyltransferase 1
MIRLGTVFSGIGAIEQAFKQLKIEHRVVFACDNGERELELDFEEINKIIKENPSKDKQEIVQDLYNETKKENLVKKSYMANYGHNLDDWYEDIRFLDGTKYENQLDILVGGSPCQSFYIWKEVRA